MLKDGTQGRDILPKQNIRRHQFRKTRCGREDRLKVGLIMHESNTLTYRFSIFPSLKRNKIDVR